MKVRKYTKEVIEQAVKSSKTLTETTRTLVPHTTSGSLRRHIGKLIEFYNIDTSHFFFKNTGTKGNKRKDWQEILVSGVLVGSKRLRTALIESGITYNCKACGIDDTWNQKSITLQVDHIDGDKRNNRPENLRFLCPNCHSQTENFGIKNFSFPEKKINTCGICGKTISRTATHCIIHNRYKDKNESFKKGRTTVEIQD